MACYIFSSLCFGFFGSFYKLIFFFFFYFLSCSCSSSRSSPQSSPLFSPCSSSLPLSSAQPSSLSSPGTLWLLLVSHLPVTLFRLNYSQLVSSCLPFPLMAPPYLYLLPMHYK